MLEKFMLQVWHGNSYHRKASDSTLKLTDVVSLYRRECLIKNDTVENDDNQNLPT